MTAGPSPVDRTLVAEAVVQLQEASAARKCWGCGCLHHALQALDGLFSPKDRPAELDAALRRARERLVPVRYDCLGCEVCYPARALNAVDQAQGTSGAGICPTEAVQERAGWPPLPGTYTVLRYRAPVAVCTLTDEELARDVARGADASLALVGTLQTENLGIERVISNVLANPHVRFVVVCGADSHQAIGHLPGQSLVALAHQGVDEQGRIRQARGKRPFLKNLAGDAVDHFRRTVEVIDLVGHRQVPEILEAVSRAAARDPGPATPFSAGRVSSIQGYVPSRMIPDPAGYFVIYPDRRRRILSLEHYRTDGVLDAVIEGRAAAELYTPVIERGLLSRLDHAAYLGRELARAEAALVSGGRYVQDAAAESPSLREPAGHACCTAQDAGDCGNPA